MRWLYNGIYNAIINGEAKFTVINGKPCLKLNDGVIYINVAYLHTYKNVDEYMEKRCQGNKIWDTVETICAACGE